MVFLGKLFEFRLLYAHAVFRMLWLKVLPHMKNHPATLVWQWC